MVGLERLLDSRYQVSNVNVEPPIYLGYEINQTYNSFITIKQDKRTLPILQIGSAPITNETGTL